MSESEKDVSEDVCEQEQEVNTAKKSRNPNFEAARAKAHEERRKLGAISRAKKFAARQQRDKDYQEALKVLNGGGVQEEPVHVEADPEPVVAKSKTRKNKKVIEIEQSSSSDEQDEQSSDSDSSIEVVKVRRKKAKPAPKKKVKKKVVETESDSSEEEDDKEMSLGGKVAREMLRQRVLKQATEDVIRRLVPYYRGN